MANQLFFKGQPNNEQFWKNSSLLSASCCIIINWAYPGSEFVVANTLAKWKKWSQMKLTLVKVLARK